MGDKTSIGWTDATFNPVWGCEKVGPGCTNCYAETLANRWRPGAGLWEGNFREFGDKHWRMPERWNRQAREGGYRTRVFCSSMADVFDNRWPEHIRPRLWDLIDATPYLDWQLVTKRIGNAFKMKPVRWDAFPTNVWIIATIVNQEEADRDMDKLLSVPARIHGVSYEPALGPVDWRPWLHGLDWIIGGGESEQRGKVRECKIEWLEDTMRQCKEAGVWYFNKQLGSNPFYRNQIHHLPAGSKGEEIDQWPTHLRVRQFPT